MAIKVITVIVSILITSLAQAIVGGEIIGVEKFPPVVMFNKLTPTILGLTKTGTCTGTFVSRNTILTAAHCLEKANYLLEHSNRYHVNDLITFPQHSNWAIRKILIHPNYKNENKKNSSLHDVAVIILDKNVDNILHFTVSSSHPKAKNLSILGYGEDRLLNGLYNLQKGHYYLFEESLPKAKKIGSCFIKRHQYLKCKKSNYNRKLFKRTNLSAQAAPGDSGGPLFDDNIIYGVISLGEFKENGYHLLSAETYFSKTYDIRNLKFFEEDVLNYGGFVEITEF